MSKDLSKNIIETIKEQKIEPKAKWNFVLKDYFVWGFFVVSIIVGGLAVSVIIHLVKIDFNSFGPVDMNVAKKVGLIVPYTWLIFLAGFVLVAYYNIKNTKKGYKVNPYLIVVLSVVVSIVLGATASVFGTGRVVENSVYRHLPMYDKIANQKMMYWNKPEDGRLMGVVIEKIDDDYYLMDIAKQKWLVKYDEDLTMFMRVRLLGEMIKIGEFEAINHMDVIKGKFKIPMCERKEECARIMR